MDGCLFEGKKLWVVCIDSGEDVLISLKKFIKEKGIKQGMVVMGYGTLAKVNMHWVCHNQWPPENNYHEWEGGIEIMGMNGMIVGVSRTSISRLPPSPGRSAGTWRKAVYATSSVKWGS